MGRIIPYIMEHIKNVETTNQWLNVYPVPSCWNAYQQNLVKKTISVTDSLEVPWGTYHFCQVYVRAMEGDIPPKYGFIMFYNDL